MPTLQGGKCTLKGTPPTYNQGGVALLSLQLLDMAFIHNRNNLGKGHQFTNSFINHTHNLSGAPSAHDTDINVQTGSLCGSLAMARA